MKREKKELCYYAEIAVMIGILEIFLSNGSQRSLWQNQTFSELGGN